FLFKACPVAADRALVHTEPRGQGCDARARPLGRLPVGPQLADVVPFGRRDIQAAAVPYDDAGDRCVPVLERGRAVAGDEPSINSSRGRLLTCTGGSRIVRA